MKPELPNVRSRKVWCHVEQVLKAEHGEKCYLAYDGQKLAYSTSSIPKINMTIAVLRDEEMDMPPVKSDGNSFGGRGGGRGGTF